MMRPIDRLQVSVLKVMSYAQFAALAQQTKKIIYFKEIAIDCLTPMHLVERLKKAGRLKKHDQDDFMLLENLMAEETARHSFLSFDSIDSFSLDAAEEIAPEKALSALRAFKHKHAYSGDQAVLEKTTLLTGFLTHDAIQLFENILSPFCQKNNDLPLLTLTLYRFNLCFDHEKSTLCISQFVDVGENTKESYQQSESAVNQLIDCIVKADPSPLISTPLISTPLVSTPLKKPTAHVLVEPTDEKFIAMINQAKAAIVAGEVFQIVLSRTFQTTYHVSPHALYLSLRELNPSPFMFYFTIHDQTVIGASPERLLKIYHKHISLTPIAGTRKRTACSDKSAIEQALLNDPKELAEHRMLVDLARNDLGRISKIGSVKIKNLLSVKHYSHISHITSEITGELKDQVDVFDALKATFPAGTLSGAPKIRALQLIHTLETHARGLYGGIICRFDVNDNFDSYIAIRMAMLKNGVATVRTGAGIVFDSDPEKEKEETEQKAHAILLAIQAAHQIKEATEHVTHD